MGRGGLERRTWCFGFLGSGGGGEEVGEGGFEGVVGAEHVDVHDRFEGVGGELGYGREEVACCSGAVVGSKCLSLAPT